VPRVDKRIALYLAVFVALVAYLYARHDQQSSAPPPGYNAAGGETWIVGQSAISQMLKAGASQQLINRAFDNDHTFVYGDNKYNHGQPSTIGVPTIAFASYVAILQAFDHGILPGKFRAVLYDNERWPATPAVEQRAPAHYEDLVSRLLRQHGLTYIATPSPDLTLTKNPHLDTFSAYLNMGLAGMAARYANVLDLQAQVRETDLPVYRAFVQTAVAQARAVNSHIAVVVGIRTNPGSVAMYQAYQATVGLGEGYWLNVNGNPGPAVFLLRRVYHMSS
jgi:hypothetical protein